MSPDAVAAEAQQIICSAVRRRRTEGAKRAIVAVARIFGLSERRVVSYLRGQVRNPPAWEFLNMRRKAAEEVELWAAQHDAEIARLRQRLAESGQL